MTNSKNSNKNRTEKRIMSEINPPGQYMQNSGIKCPDYCVNTGIDSNGNYWLFEEKVYIFKIIPKNLRDDPYDYYYDNQKSGTKIKCKIIRRVE